MSNSSDGTPNLPVSQQETLPGQPAPRNQWLWDQVYLGLAHLKRLRLVRGPKDDVELDDLALAWADQLHQGFRWNETEMETRAIEAAFRRLANFVEEWPAPKLFWEFFIAPGTSAKVPDLSPREPVNLEGLTEHQLYVRDAFRYLIGKCRTPQEKARMVVAIAGSLHPHGKYPSSWRPGWGEDELQKAVTFMENREGG